jgi:hypothetical protein
MNLYQGRFQCGASQLSRPGAGRFNCDVTEGGYVTEAGCVIEARDVTHGRFHDPQRNWAVESAETGNRVSVSTGPSWRIVEWWDSRIVPRRKTNMDHKKKRRGFAPPFP